MSALWPMVRLGDVVAHRKQFVMIDDLTTYKRCRVQLHVQGIVLRDRVTGAEIKTKSQQVCRAGDFLVAEIDAKMGGFGIVPDALDGAIVSSHYFLFEVDERKLDRGFLGWYCKTPAFREQVNAQGTTNYAAIRPAHVLNYAIPLPPPTEQRRIVERLDYVADRLNCAANARQEALDLTPHAIRSMLRALFHAPGDSTVGDFANVQSGYAFKSDWFTDDGIRLARNVNVGHGTLGWVDVARVPEQRHQEFLRFALSEGDILVSLDRPLISTGVKVAMVQKEDLPCLLLQRVGRFQFKGQRLLPEYLFGWLHSPHFTGAIDPGRSNGVPHISQRDIERISFCPPPIPVQERAVARWRELRVLLSEVARNVKQATAEAEALLPAVLNRAFAGAL